MLHIPLEQLTEKHLLRLRTDGTPEGARLEFKQQVDLKTRAERREVAKDVSALANSVGGRIVYGISEEKQSDGTSTAGKIMPLTSGDVEESLENIIATTISPRPHFRIHRVSVARGFCLVVEVYPSSGRDLHMVSAYGDQRFYRRGEQSVMRMTEAEIREAYRRIATSTLQLEVSIEREVAAESCLRQDAEESIIIVPWYAARNMADPRMIYQIGYDLGKKATPQGPMATIDYGHFISDMRVSPRGLTGLYYRSPPGYEKESPETADRYFAVTRSGVLHYSRQSATQRRPSLRGGEALTYDVLASIRTIAATVVGAGLVYDRIGYWGPVRILHILDFPAPVWISDENSFEAIIGAGSHKQEVSEVNLREARGSINQESFVRSWMKCSSWLGW